MYETGHIGSGILLFSPVAFVAALFGGEGAGFMGFVLVAGLTTAPDLDMRVPFIKHRGITHTVWCALAVGAVMGVGGLVVGAQEGILSALLLGIYAFAIGVVAIIAHILADSITPMGIQPLAPYSNTKYTYDIAKAANPIANYALLGIGGIVGVASIYAAILIRSLLGF